MNKQINDDQENKASETPAWRRHRTHPNASRI